MKLAARGFFSLVDCYYNKSFRKRIVRLNLILFSFMFVDKNEQRTKSVHRSFLFFIPTLLTLLFTILTAAMQALFPWCAIPMYGSSPNMLLLPCQTYWLTSHHNSRRKSSHCSNWFTVSML